MSIPGRKGKFSLKATDAESADIYWERIEDVLTADVFGAYRYLPTDYGILQLLKHARDEHERPLFAFLRKRQIIPQTLEVARIRFWPNLADGREPDALVLLGPSTGPPTVALLVEAKLHSSQHEIDGCSQIGHYLKLHLQCQYADDMLAEAATPVRPLLFVTAHPKMPRAQLIRARQEVQKSSPSVPAEDIGIFWVSWADAGGEAKRLWRRDREQLAQKPWLRLLLDMVQDLATRDLMPRPSFVSVLPAPVPKPDWAFQQTYARPRLNFDKMGGLPYAERVYVHAFEHTVVAGPLGRRSYWARPAIDRLPDRTYVSAREL